MTPSDAVNDEVLFRVDGAIATITLNRPDSANALRPEGRNRIIELLDECDGRADVRAIVLRAEGRHFCAGADAGGIRAGQAGERRTGDAIRLLMSGSQRLISSVLDCGKPVIAEVQGTAAGLGAHLAFACDLVVAAQEASFIESMLLRGIVLDAVGAYLLPRRVGLQKAKELALLGDTLPAAEAAALGLVNRVVPRDDLRATVTELAERLAAGPTSAIALTKRLLNLSLDQDRASALLAEAMAQEVQMTATDATEGVAAFIERRPPDYLGR
ncbi:MAG TPA: enoyl-CoA hydratase/isomerase family protein [Mycobacteriales bacterium]|jgi:2-(1,2-epoxy-1,2-dihydrophenyl)acetyl-CoA isomerase|nr:enoyl-CoA hydratase/isomerase family protein [Mycobacteriales bacterium]